MLSRYLSHLEQSSWRSVSVSAVQRLSTQADVKADATTASVSWEKARPFSEVPGLTQFQFIRGFLPGGEHYKKPIIDMMKSSLKKFGPLFRFPGMFGKPGFLLDFNPDDFAVIFHNEGPWPKRRSFESVTYYREVHRRDFFQGMEGIIATNGEKWAKVRTLVNPILMQPKNVRLYFDSLLDVNDDFLQRVREIRDPVSHEMPDDFMDELSRLTFEGIAVVALNTKLGLIKRDRGVAESQIFLDSLRRFSKLVESLEMRPSIWKIWKTSQFHELMKTQDVLTDLCNKYISEALTKIERNADGQLTSAEGKEKSVLEKLLRVDKTVAVVMALDMLTAGVDTSSSSLAGILLCLSTSPEKQQKLFDELHRILPSKDSPLTVENMQNLPYLRACIKEGLRLYPIIPGTMRNLTKDVVLSGYRVPAGIDIAVGSNLLMQDENYVPLANEFIPERWLRSEQSGKGLEGHIANPFMYLPFGFGPRSCVGRRIVNMELEITLARLVRNFTIQFNYSTKNAFTMNFINVPCIPLKFKMEERNS